MKDRLYLIEEADKARDEAGELINPQPGRRIFVLSSQGDTLQVSWHGLMVITGHLFSDVLCCFDGKLLAPIQDNTGRYDRIIALAGV